LVTEFPDQGAQLRTWVRTGPKRPANLSDYQLI